MGEFSPQELKKAYERYVQARNRVEAGKLGWAALADFFTEDATFIDPAWGRVRGRAAIRRFMEESMSGLEDWSFPHQWTMVEGSRIVAKWMNRLPGRRPDGGYYEAPGLSVIEYAGDGLFSYEEDLLNMVHVVELMKESGWRPNERVKAPPSPPPR